MNTIIFLLAWIGISFSGYTQSRNYFTPLFNGKDLSGWNMPGETSGFDVKNGIMVAVPHNGSDIFTEEYFGNYILRLEYLLSEAGNSGVLIRCDPADPWRTGVEIQLLAPWTPYRDDLHCTGSVYGHVAVSDRPDETTGIWHKMEIKCDRKIITISVDGKVTTVANTDTVPGMKDKLLCGAIGFQSNHSKEGEFAHFRNIAVYDMDSDIDYVSAGFYDNDARVRKQAWNAAEKRGPEMIGRLVSMLSGSNTMAQTGARQTLFNLVAKSTEPGALPSQREDILNKLEQEINADHPVPVTGYLEWLSGLAGAVDNNQIKPGGTVLAEEEKAQGFALLFNGINLDGWQGNTTDYFADNGELVLQPARGGSGNLYTDKEYSDFIMRFEFMLTPGANNGLGIRAPLKGDAAYEGMELQILDNTAPVFASLKEYQYHGSVYGVIPARRGYLKPVGEWNEQEVVVMGTQVRVTLNGTVILNGDIANARDNGTMDGKEHPGLKRDKGYIGFLGHGSELKFRNIRIKDISN